MLDSSTEIYLNPNKLSYLIALLITCNKNGESLIGAIKKEMWRQGFRNNRKFDNTKTEALTRKLITERQHPGKDNAKLISITDYGKKYLETNSDSIEASYHFKQLVWTIEPHNVWTGSTSIIEAIKDTHYDQHSTTFNSPHPLEWLPHLEIDELPLKTSKVKFTINDKNYKEFQIPLTKGTHIAKQIRKKPLEQDQIFTPHLDIPEFELNIFFEECIPIHAILYRNKKKIFVFSKHKREFHGTFTKVNAFEKFHLKIMTLVNLKYTHQFY